MKLEADTVNVKCFLYNCSGKRVTPTLPPSYRANHLILVRHVTSTDRVQSYRGIFWLRPRGNHARQADGSAESAWKPRFVDASIQAVLVRMHLNLFRFVVVQTEQTNRVTAYK